MDFLLNLHQYEIKHFDFNYFYFFHPINLSIVINVPAEAVAVVAARPVEAWTLYELPLVAFNIYPVIFLYLSVKFVANVYV